MYGGGHGSFESSGYDCSGSVSFALHGGGLLSAPLDSTGFMTWGDPGPGQWITVYSNPGHAYMEIAGLRFDTSGGAAALAGNAARLDRLRRHTPGLLGRTPGATLRRWRIKSRSRRSRTGRLTARSASRSTGLTLRRQLPPSRRPATAHRWWHRRLAASHGELASGAGLRSLLATASPLGA